MDLKESPPYRLVRVSGEDKCFVDKLDVEVLFLQQVPLIGDYLLGEVIWKAEGKLGVLGPFLSSLSFNLRQTVLSSRITIEKEILCFKQEIQSKDTSPCGREYEKKALVTEVHILYVPKSEEHLKPKIGDVIYFISHNTNGKGDWIVETDSGKCGKLDNDQVSLASVNQVLYDGENKKNKDTHIVSRVHPCIHQGFFSQLQCLPASSVPHRIPFFLPLSQHLKPTFQSDKKGIKYSLLIGLSYFYLKKDTLKYVETKLEVEYSIILLAGRFCQLALKEHCKLYGEEPIISDTKSNITMTVKALPHENQTISIAQGQAWGEKLWEESINSIFALGQQLSLQISIKNDSSKNIQEVKVILQNIIEYLPPNKVNITTQKKTEELKKETTKYERSTICKLSIPKSSVIHRQSRQFLTLLDVPSTTQELAPTFIHEMITNRYVIKVTCVISFTENITIILPVYFKPAYLLAKRDEDTIARLQQGFPTPLWFPPLNPSPLITLLDFLPPEGNWLKICRDVIEFGNEIRNQPLFASDCLQALENYHTYIWKNIFMYFSKMPDLFWVVACSYDLYQKWKNSLPSLVHGKLFHQPEIIQDIDELEQRVLMPILVHLHNYEKGQKLVSVGPRSLDTLDIWRFFQKMSNPYCIVAVLINNQICIPRGIIKKEKCISLQHIYSRQETVEQSICKVDLLGRCSYESSTTHFMCQSLTFYKYNSNLKQVKKYWINFSTGLNFPYYDEKCRKLEACMLATRDRTGYKKGDIITVLEENLSPENEWMVNLNGEEITFIYFEPMHWKIVVQEKPATISTALINRTRTIHMRAKSDGNTEKFYGKLNKTQNLRKSKPKENLKPQKEDTYRNKKFQNSEKPVRTPPPQTYHKPLQMRDTNLVSPDPQLQKSHHLTSQSLNCPQQQTLQKSHHLTQSLNCPQQQTLQRIHQRVAEGDMRRLEQRGPLGESKVERGLERKGEPGGFMERGLEWKGEPGGFMERGLERKGEPGGFMERGPEWKGPSGEPRKVPMVSIEEDGPQRKHVSSGDLDVVSVAIKNISKVYEHDLKGFAILCEQWGVVYTTFNQSIGDLVNKMLNKVETH